MTATAPALTVINGKCANCKRRYRLTVATSLVRTGALGWTVSQVADAPKFCDCRDGVPCTPKTGVTATGRAWSRTACGIWGDSDEACTGHAHTAINWKAVKATVKADKACDSSCKTARGNECLCSCGGLGHGVHAH